ncbi:MAG TPA: hypothetical protein VFJ90_16435, partial [Candidatus Didemnitutus sp.]|nr:hypothetical protein [Candidatus Didemnitutus sp.]
MKSGPSFSRESSRPMCAAPSSSRLVRMIFAAMFAVVAAVGGSAQPVVKYSEKLSIAWGKVVPLSPDLEPGEMWFTRERPKFEEGGLLNAEQRNYLLGKFDSCKGTVNGAPAWGLGRDFMDNFLMAMADDSPPSLTVVGIAGPRDP